MNIEFRLSNSSLINAGNFTRKNSQIEDAAERLGQG